MDGRPDTDRVRLRHAGFDELSGWADDDHAEALGAFRRGAGILATHPPKARASGIDPGALAGAIRRAAALPAATTRAAAREFFERAFTPALVESAGFFTGYYEPEVAGSRTPGGGFNVPLYRAPDDLVEIEPGAVPGLDPSFRFARRTGAGLAEHPDRGAIMAGALDGRGLELVYLRDPVDAFFIQVQGAARIRLGDGTVLRITYAGKTGHPYTSIGKVLIDTGGLERGAVTMQTIRAWLAAHPDRAGAVLAHNRSYVFFREAPVGDETLGPIAAAKVPLTAGRSLAVDRTLHTFHAPVFIETTLPDGTLFQRLMVAQDTGSAIVGAARGDIFFGSGEAAGEIAGAMQGRGRFFVLVPRGSAP
jgi:membrane-bound lytic murein transglycosylase A